MPQKNLPITKYWLLLLLAFSPALPGQAQAEPVFTMAARPELYEQVYLSEAQALKKVMGGLKLSKKQLKLTPQQRKKIQRRLRRKLPKSGIPYYVGKSQGKTQRYAFILDEKGKHFPITFIVALKPDASVHQVAVMVYREKRGDGVKRRRFLSQFPGKDGEDPIEVNQDIVHITGSTISSWSIAAGVRKAVALLEDGIQP